MRKAGVVIGVAVMLAGCGFVQRPAGPTEHEHQVVELDKAELTRVRLTMGGGELTVKGGAAKLVEADFDYNVPAWKPTVTHTATGTVSEVAISQGSQTGTFGRTENRWQVSLNDSMPMDVSAHVGGGEVRMTLGSLNLRYVELQIGAGQMEMDLRGKPTKSYKVSIVGGAGQATVYLPATVAISATASGVIGDINVSGLEKRNDRWINPRAGSSPVTIELDVKGGVGEIRIVAE